MMQSFYKQKPTVDTPYRQLLIEHNGRNWQVRLLGGTKWGRENAEELKNIPAKDFDEANKFYDKEFVEVQAGGWKAYSPYVSW
jgi:hypothetical protein